MRRYIGPVQDEPLAVELHNTLYVVRGRAFDGLGDQAGADAWLAAISDRVPREVRGGRVPAHTLRELRDSVRAVLHAALDDTPPPRTALRALNAVTAAAPEALTAQLDAGGHVTLTRTRPGSTRAGAVLAVLAASTLELVGGQRRQDLRACGAPGCVLMFVKDHPRREWCSVACGNRARQARLAARRRTAIDAATDAATDAT
jgi:predicted RNA-binding Zn ribbon-like protein